jgi:adenosylhomocysteine nucleosidase
VERILVVAAEAREFAGLLARCKDSIRLPWGLPVARQVQLGGSQLFLVAAGQGQELAGRAADAAGSRLRFDAVVSTGSCGGLDPVLRTAEVFVAVSVLAMDSGERYETRTPECAAPYASGVLVSTGQVIRSVEEKKRLYALGARAVEMEASAVAARALAWGVPFFCVRAIADRADEELLLDYNATRDTNGGLSTARILAQAMRRPLDLAPELYRMHRGSRLAARAVGDFLVHCRF